MEYGYKFLEILIFLCFMGGLDFKLFKDVIEFFFDKGVVVKFFDLKFIDLKKIDFDIDKFYEVEDMK